MLNTINVNLSTDIKKSKATDIGIELKSQDINNNLFILKFTDNGKSIALNDSYTVEILTKFEKSKSHRLTSAAIYRDYARWDFDTSFITQDEKVTNYVYVRKAGSLVVSADANAFAFDVGLSEIDKDAGRVAEVYDENYEKKLDDYMAGFDEKLSEEVSIQLQSKANREQEEWITPTLFNGWVGSTYWGGVTYRKDTLGVVHIVGACNLGIDMLIFTLPVGYRPDKVRTPFIVYTNTGTIEGQIVASTGDVRVPLFSGKGELKFYISFKVGD